MTRSYADERAGVITDASAKWHALGLKPWSETMSEPAKVPAGGAMPDDMDAAADEAIPTCGDDARATVKALLVLDDG